MEANHNNITHTRNVLDQIEMMKKEVESDMLEIITDYLSKQPGESEDVNIYDGDIFIERIYLTDGQLKACNQDYNMHSQSLCYDEIKAIFNYLF